MLRGQLLLQQYISPIPDTDVYMIGLPLQCTQDKDIIVQISDMNSRELKLLYMKRLIAALSNEPDPGADPGGSWGADDPPFSLKMMASFRKIEPFSLAKLQLLQTFSS